MGKPVVHFRSSDGSWFRVWVWRKNATSISPLDAKESPLDQNCRIMVGPYMNFAETISSAKQWEY